MWPARLELVAHDQLEQEQDGQREERDEQRFKLNERVALESINKQKKDN